ncbi:MAG: FAD-dependent oxidoreductase [Anaerolineae bacterium]|nr:FAD-dependent oxidoreductase [Anaerolineae bacterium]
MANEKTINLVIDGKAIVAEAGKTILQIAREHQIDIPTLCYDPRLPAYASCLVCVVEVEQNGKSRLLLSCTTEAADGMSIQTKNEAVIRARKNALDMLLSNHFADCRGPCYENCPAGVDVQGYLALANAGRYREALELIRKTNPLPLVCGRVCVHYCEAACRRKNVDSAVAVNFIKRYVADLETDNLPRPQPVPSNGHKVAVVGGGPAGLTAAYFLAKRGYQVTIFEAHPKLGGMLRYGIPDYRLPGPILDKEIQYILDHGVEVRTNQRLGKDFTLGNLKEWGFEAIFLALGSQKAKAMRVKGEDASGVIGGINFLEMVKKQGAPDFSGQRVLVVGGGNTAIDAARTALRCKASDVTIVYRRTREEMPADPVEIHDALEEGVHIEFLVAPVGVVTEDGNVRALRCQRMELGAPDASGRRSPVPVEGSEFDIACNIIIAAIGQDSSLEGIQDAAVGEIEITRFNTISINEATFATSIEGVFAGGDVVSGPAAAVDAIGDGRKVAEVIDIYLREGVIRPASTEFLSKRTELDTLPADFFAEVEKSERSTMVQTPVEQRLNSFDEVDHGILPEDLARETARCLSCGCSDVFTCKLKQYAGEYGAEQKRFKGVVKKYKKDERHPYITLDPNKCVLCGLCVRTCESLIGVSALGFINRGFEMIIGSALGNALQDTNCITCGNCIEVCPTGAISFNLGLKRPGPWATLPDESICSFCGVGCRLVYNKVNDRIWYVTAKMSDAYTHGDLCVRGRFGHRYLYHETRIKGARVDGREVGDLEKALAQALDGLRSVIQKHGSDSVAVLVTPKASNEELFLARRLAVEGLGTAHVTSLYSLAMVPRDDSLHKSLGLSAATLPAEQVEEADVIILVNSNVTTENPVLGFRVMRAAKRGAHIVLIGSTDVDIEGVDLQWLNARRGSNAVLLSALAGDLLRRGNVDNAYLRQYVDGVETLQGVLPSIEQAAEASAVEKEQIESLAVLLADREKNVVFVYDADSMVDRSPGDLQAIVNLLLLTGRLGKSRNGLMLTRRHVNSLGHDLILGGLSTPEEISAALSSGKIKAIFSIGEDLTADEAYQYLLERLEYLVAMDIVETPTTSKANVVLPASALAETAGSITSHDRRVKAFEPAFVPPSGVTSFEVLAALLSKALGGEKPTLQSVREQLANKFALYLPVVSLGGKGEFYLGLDSGGVFFEKGFLTPNGKAVLACPPLKPGRSYHERTATYSALESLFAQQYSALRR